MQAMELVDIENVYPYEENDVRMNPRDVGSKECRAYIAELAEQFKRNRLNPGQPRVRPILYRDGGIYQIVDGECRYEAMRLIGTKRFYADVFDSIDDAETAKREAAKAMVETDCKRALTAEEMSRGVQTMLALDIPDDEVAAAARIDAGRIRKARKGAAKASDAAYDMTLDRLIAIADFEDDPEAVEKLSGCSEREWQGVYQRLLSDRSAREILDRMTAVAYEAGIEVTDETPEGYAADKVFYPYDYAVSMLEKHLGTVDERAVAVCTSRSVTIALPAEEDGNDEAKQREAQERAEFYAEYDDADMARAKWIAEHCADMATMKSTARFLTDKALENRYVESFEESTGVEVPNDPSILSIALGYESLSYPNPWMVWEGHGIWEGYARDAAGLLDAMAEDGYELCSAEKATLNACREAIGGDDE